VLRILKRIILIGSQEVSCGICLIDPGDFLSSFQKPSKGHSVS
jgi:hypothetical protein